MRSWRWFTTRVAGLSAQSRFAQVLRAKGDDEVVEDPQVGMAVLHSMARG